MSLHELLTLTERFLLQQEDGYILLDKETKSEFQGMQHAKRTVQSIKQLPAAPQPQPVKPIEARKEPVPAEKTKVVIPTPVIFTKPIEVQGIACLPHPFKRPEAPLFDEIKAKARGVQLKSEQADDRVAQQKEAAWKQTVPSLLFFSFFPKHSEKAEFLETVVAAARSKLAPTEIIYLPDTESLTYLYIACQAKLLKGAILVFDPESRAKANEFLLPLSLEHEAKTSDVFFERSRLYETPLFDLTISDTMSKNSDEKRALWNHLKAVVNDAR